MLSSVVPYALVAIALVAVWAGMLAKLGVFTPPEVRAWQRIAALRGFAQPAGRFERAAERSRVLQQLRDELNLSRLLAEADRPETETGFISRSAFQALVGVTIVVVVDASLRLQGGDFPVPLWCAALVGAAIFLGRISALRTAAQSRRTRADHALGDMMTMVAVITDGRGLQVDDAVRILARCATRSDLHTLVDGGWRRLVTTSPRSTVDLYRAIADEYRLSRFRQVADAMATTNVGMAERVTYTRVAQAVYQQRLVEARIHAARARILVTLPVAGMLIPLLLLLGAPTFSSITAGLGGG